MRLERCEAETETFDDEGQLRLQAGLQTGSHIEEKPSARELQRH
jgi:hypothetical protein